MQPGGRFTTEEATQIVTHWIIVSSMPEWAARGEERTAAFAGERLILVTSPRMQGDGQSVTIEIVWERA